MSNKLAEKNIPVDLNKEDKEYKGTGKAETKDMACNKGDKTCTNAPEGADKQKDAADKQMDAADKQKDTANKPKAAGEVKKV